MVIVTGATCQLGRAVVQSLFQRVSADQIVAIAESGLAYTSLRHGFYAESCLQMIGDDLGSGELRTPEDGPTCWTARADLAEADAAILVAERDWNDITSPLASAKAITMAEIATIASDVTGRKVRHTVVSDEEWRNAKVAAGLPPLMPTCF